jgi:3-hydroxy acid dehydrogenase / malonic semialdehyde reductase
MKKTVLITGATAGFGEACAEIFASNGYRVIINGRRTERLQTLKERLEKDHHAEVLSLPFDVRNREEVFSAITSLPEEWTSIDVLVNMQDSL